MLIPSLYATSLRTRSLRPVRVPSDQNTRWRLQRTKSNQNKKNSPVEPAIGFFLGFDNFFATLDQIPTSIISLVRMENFHNCFATLTEIPTGIIPLVTMVKFPKFFATLCEIPTGIISSVYLLVKLSIFLQNLHVFMSILLHKMLNCKLTARTTQ